MSRLLLFTNEYPYRTGDVVFVQNEIDALAARFDDVVVFCHARDTSGGVVSMPPNVRLGGNLFDPAPEDAPRQLLEWGAISLLLAATWRELLAGTLLKHPKLFFLASKVGITQAHRKAVREAIAGDDDVVAYGFWGMGGGLGVPWLRGVRARTVRVHRYDLYREEAPHAYLPFRPFLFRRADRVLAISEDGMRYLARTEPATRTKTVLSRLGVFGPDAAPAHPPQEERIVVSCSSVSDVKRVGLILDAVRALAAVDVRRPVRWVHFGDGPLARQLRSAARELPDSVRIELRGQVSNRELHDFYAHERVDVFVNASLSEGVPVSIMEAISYGIPVVATAVGGTPEIIGPAQRTGELVPALVTADALAAVIGRVADAAPGTYAPHEFWAREYDARLAGQRAAELVWSAGR
ncbi:glycosyltransferase [Microbacterium aerolatum]|uniref:glycosyltransferase n=1 Tax=Microbacterium aerolatum TaxID=153731 RepID=UPI002000ABE9|nr:glycosyltransferase [Microbacterium aerolatum]MCK3770207.1 glycosyltransferase [Microbacterium aerolatum]